MLTLPGTMQKTDLFGGRKIDFSLKRVTLIFRDSAYTLFDDVVVSSDGNRSKQSLH